MTTFDDKKLFIRTKSIPTAAAMWLLTGVAPRVLRRPSGDTMFEFDPEHEAILRRFIKAKDAVDALATGRSA